MIQLDIRSRTKNPIPSVVRNPSPTPPKKTQNLDVSGSDSATLLAAMGSAETFPGGQRRHFAYLSQVADVAIMASERGFRKALPPLDFENLRTKCCFLSSKWEKTNFTTFEPLEKIWKNSLVPPLDKNSSDAHGCNANGSSQNAILFLRRKDTSPSKLGLHSHPFWNIFQVELWAIRVCHKGVLSVILICYNVCWIGA